MISVAASNITPMKVQRQSMLQPAWGMPMKAMPQISASIAGPIAEPSPPAMQQPPTTTAMIAKNSNPTPAEACTPVNRTALLTPTSQAAQAVSMKSPILVALTGTPTARAAVASPPGAKIQFPSFVRQSTQEATSANTSHQIREMRKSVGRCP